MIDLGSPALYPSVASRIDNLTEAQALVVERHTTLLNRRLYYIRIQAKLCVLQMTCATRIARPCFQTCVVVLHSQRYACSICQRVQLLSHHGISETSNAMKYRSQEWPLANMALSSSQQKGRKVNQAEIISMRMLRIPVSQYVGTLMCNPHAAEETGPGDPGGTGPEQAMMPKRKVDHGVFA